MLTLDGLVRRFGATTALDDLSFEVPGGQVFGFLARTERNPTAMRAILRLTALDAGEVRWNGSSYGFDFCKRIGYMPEERGLYPTMRVIDQLIYLGRLHAMTADDARRASTLWLDRLGLGERGHDKVEALSLGNQQRVQLAAALIHSPDLLVLDEPFSGLDPAGVDDLGGVLAERAADGVTVLFSSHQLDLVESICESVAIVESRKVRVAAGPVRDLVRGGRPRLVVAVEGDTRGDWAHDLPGVTVAANDRGRLRLVVAPDVDPQSVLAAAMAHGPVDHFGFEARRLSEVFRESVGAPPAEGTATAGAPADAATGARP